MPGKIYTLENSSDKLKVNWGFNFKNYTIFLNDKKIGEIKNRKDLKHLNKFSLDEQRDLTVQLISDFMSTRVNLKINDEHIPNSPGDPERIRRSATLFTLFFGVVNIIIGLIIMSHNPYDKEAREWGMSALIFGVINCGLSAWIYASKSKLAVIITTVISGIDLLLSILFMIAIGKFTGLIALKIFWIQHLISAINVTPNPQEKTLLSQLEEFDQESTLLSQLEELESAGTSKENSKISGQENQTGCFYLIGIILFLSVFIYFVRFGAQVAEYDKVHLKRAFVSWLNGYRSFESVFDQLIDFFQAISIIGIWASLPLFIIGLTIAVINAND